MALTTLGICATTTSAQTPSVGDREVVDPFPIPQVKLALLDAEGDAVMRRTHIGPTLPPTVGTGKPDLIYATLGQWLPTNPLNDPYTGSYGSAGDFLRLDLVFLGLVNPPGPLGSPYAPGLYGSNPVFGQIEFDMDANVETGGDTAQPEFGYNANVARFGGMPQGSEFQDRVGTDGISWNRLNFNAVPAIHRSGEEFHVLLAMDDSYPPTITFVVGDSDGFFEAGETWEVEGYFFRRGRGYDVLTYADGYEPLVVLRFAHDVGRNQTTLSFVYPLDNTAYAALHGTPPEENDFDSWNANSVLEALNDLWLSARYPPEATTNHPHRPLLAPWANQDPLNYLQPWDWRCTALLGTALQTALPTGSGGVHVWTDIWPNVVNGDFNGDGMITASDAQRQHDFIVLHDGDPNYDTDGGGNGSMSLLDFALRFSIFDRDYDGFLSEADDGLPAQGPCDYDNDSDVDLRDFQALQSCFSPSVVDAEDLRYVACLDAFDDNGDHDIDLADYAVCVLDSPAVVGLE